MTYWPDRGTEPPLASGRYAPEQIVAELMVEPFNPGPEQQAAIEAEWRRRVADAARRGARLYDGPLVRLAGLSDQGGVLRLELQRTSFRLFVGTNLRDPSLPDGQRADPLGNSAVVVSADGRVILGRRSRRVFGHPGALHCIGGHIEPDCIDAEGRVDTFAAIAAEVVEELNVEKGDIESCVCLGIVRDAASRQPEQLFALRLAVPSGALESASGEHEALVVVPNSPQELEGFLKKHSERIVPVARAALRLHVDNALGAPGGGA